MIASILSGIWLRLALILAGISTVAAILFGVRQSGRHAERVDNLERALEGSRHDRKIEADMRGRTPHEHGKWLRRPEHRDR